MDDTHEARSGGQRGEEAHFEAREEQSYIANSLNIHVRVAESENLVKTAKTPIFWGAIHVTTLVRYRIFGSILVSVGENKKIKIIKILKYYT